MAKGASRKKSGGGGVIVALLIAVIGVLGLIWFSVDGSMSDQSASLTGQRVGTGEEQGETESVAAAGRVRVPGAGDPPAAGGAAIEQKPGEGRPLPAPTEQAASTDVGEKPEAPEFDVVRVAEDGSAVLAGRAEPGASVEVLIDGEVAQTVQADEESGEFVAMIQPPRGPAPEGGVRRLDLSAVTPDGRRSASEAPVIVTMPEEPDEPPAALRPAVEGVEMLQPTPKAAGAGVTIDAVTYGEKGDLTIAGRGKPGETARLYLDNNLQAEAEVKEDGGWRASIKEDVPPAVYQLRVDQTSPQGEVTARAETPFERANPANIKLEKGAVVVQPGNNLWRIADYVYGDGARYTVIYRRNKSQIRDPDLIYPGQVFNLPESPGE